MVPCVSAVASVMSINHEAALLKGLGQSEDDIAGGTEDSWVICGCHVKESDLCAGSDSGGVFCMA